MLDLWYIGAIYWRFDMAKKTLEAHLYESLSRGDKKKALYVAVLLGNNVNNIYRGKSPLCWAREFGNEEVLACLEKKGAKDILLTRDENIEVAKKINKAMEEGDNDKAIELMDVLGNVDIRVGKWWEPLLMLAGKCGNREIVERLIERGADLEVQNNFNRTTLEEVFYECNFDIADYLIEKGAKKESLNNCLQRAYSKEKANYLIEKGILPSEEDVSWAIRLGYEDIAMIYLSCAENMDINVKDETNKSLLLYAIHEKQNSVAFKLLELGAKHDSDMGGSVLLDAAYCGNIEIVKKMVDEGEDINQVNMYNQTPLYLAVLNAKSLEVIEFLMKNGADYSIARDNGDTPLVCAVKHKESKVLKVLLDNINEMPKDFVLALHESADGSEERKLLKDFMEKMSKKNVPEVEKIKLNMMNERY